MNRATKALIAATTLLVCVLLNFFYIDYSLSVENHDRRKFLISWTPLLFQRTEYIETHAKKNIRPEKSYVIQSPSEREISDMRARHTDKYCRFPKDWRVSEGFSRMICSKEFVRPKVTRTRKVVPAITYAQARREIESSKNLHHLRFGMIPARNIAGEGEPSRAAMAKSYWLGIVVPVLLLSISLGFFLSTLSNNRKA